MHNEAYGAMAAFAAAYAKPGHRVADIGSYDVSGTFRPLFSQCEYVGIDIAAGPGVDRVVEPYQFGEGGFDLVVSGSTMEHVEDLKLWSAACIAIAKPGAAFCIIAPHGTSGFTEHRHPVDCWRIWPDGMRWLFRELDIIECRTDPRDTVMIARKP